MEIKYVKYKSGALRVEIRPFAKRDVKIFVYMNLQMTGGKMVFGRPEINTPCCSLRDEETLLMIKGLQKASEVERDMRPFIGVSYDQAPNWPVG